MSNNNSVKMVGNLGADPEVRVNSATGKSFASISLGVHKSWVKEGVKEERTDWFRCIVGGKLVDEVKALKKGTFIQIEGEMGTRKYDDKVGVTHYETFVRPYTVKKIEAKAKAEADVAPEASEATPAFDDALPF